MEILELEIVLFLLLLSFFNIFGHLALAYHIHNHLCQQTCAIKHVEIVTCLVKIVVFLKENYPDYKENSVCGRCDQICNPIHSDCLLILDNCSHNEEHTACNHIY